MLKEKKMKFILTVVISILVFGCFVCLVYMLAKDRKLRTPDALIEYKLKWFYLVLFVVLSSMVVGLFYLTYLGGVL